MREFFNHYSAAVLVLTIVALGALLVWQHRRNRWVLGAIAVGTIALVIGYAQLRSGPSSITVASTLDAELGNGTSILVEVYSDF
jgi:heme A synthase